MSTPITWRTVNGPSLAEASRPLQVAGLTLNSGFDALGDALKQQETVDKANWQQQKENNTNAFLNQIYAANGPEGFKALQDSGQLQQMLSGFGAQIDQAKAREVMDSRLGTLQKRDQENWAYQNAALDQQEAPQVNEAKALIAQGKVDQATPLINSLSTRAQASLFSAADEKTQQLLERKWKAEKHPLELQQIRAQINSSNASANNSRIQGEAAQFRLNEEKKAADAALLKSKMAVALQDNIYSEGVLKPGDTEELATLMKNNKIGADGFWDDTQAKQAKMMAKINRLAMNGMEVSAIDPATGKEVKQTIPVPLGAVKAAILSSGNRLFSWNEGWADEFESQIKKRIGAVGKIDGNGLAATSSNRALDDFTTYQGVLANKATVPADKSGKR